MRSFVELGPRAESNPLARELLRRVEGNLARVTARSAFRRLIGTVVVVCQKDPPPGADPGRPLAPKSTLTLRFDYGHLVIYEGRVGRPDITLWGTEAEILALGATGLGRVLGGQAGSRLEALVFALLPTRSGGPRVFGKLSHPSLSFLLARLLRAPG